jgi:preprotein translocase subunit YajC
MKIKSLLAAAVIACGTFLYAAPEAKAPAISNAPAAGQALPGSAVTKAAPAAENSEAKAPQKKAGGLMDFLPIILIIVAFYFFIFRGNKKQQQKRQEALDRTVKGTRVMLNSGVLGKVVEVREKEFLVEIAENVRVLVVKSGVTPLEEEAEDKKAGENK